MSQKELTVHFDLLTQILCVNWLSVSHIWREVVTVGRGVGGTTHRGRGTEAPTAAIVLAGCHATPGPRAGPGNPRASPPFFFSFTLRPTTIAQPDHHHAHPLSNYVVRHLVRTATHRLKGILA